MTADPTKRGVVSTAKLRGAYVRDGAAMPLRTAYKRNPDAVSWRWTRRRYLEASKRVMDVSVVPRRVVEVMGWDEAFMAVTTDDSRGAGARRAGRRSGAGRDLWCSIGATRRSARSSAAGSTKPRGVFRLTRALGRGDGRPAHRRARGHRLRARKLATSGCARWRSCGGDESTRAALGPKTGPWLRQLATGEGGSAVSAEPWVPRGVSRERTFERRLEDSG